jgi:hypothetical protein
MEFSHGRQPVQAVDVALVMKVLSPIWNEKPETRRSATGDKRNKTYQCAHWVELARP